MASSSRPIKPESLPTIERAAVSCILSIFPPSRVEHTHEKYPRSKRLGLEAR